MGCGEFEGVWPSREYKGAIKHKKIIILPGIKQVFAGLEIGYVGSIIGPLRANI